MPTNQELAKEVQLLRDELKNRNAELKKEFDVANTEEFRSLRNELHEAQNSLAFMNKDIEELKAKCDSLSADNTKLKQSNDLLETNNTDLTRQVAQLEQYSRLNNVEIRGVPNNPTEDPGELLTHIGNHINCPITKADIDIVHRVPTPSQPNAHNIIARFISRDHKNDFQKKARRARITSKDLNLQEEPRQIFFNDHLSPLNKKLFSAALRLKKDKEWMHLWTDQCVIKARKTNGSSVHKIVSQDDLSVFV
ncbi:uncharacterized protein LOC120846440 [Ixodes scapularis]|uniref:uncharacterized protein LOC120846440 n=1 Tax=Ixodes scapularis TaxID=6945 RepID=UPI001A9EE34F|nr:uncharacterized protein LOC120846440 [Ixodes scapularis]